MRRVVPDGGMPLTPSQWLEFAESAKGGYEVFVDDEAVLNFPLSYEGAWNAFTISRSRNAGKRVVMVEAGSRVGAR